MPFPTKQPAKLNDTTTRAKATDTFFTGISCNNFAIGAINRNLASDHLVQKGHTESENGQLDLGIFGTKVPIVEDHQTRAIPLGSLLSLHVTGPGIPDNNSGRSNISYKIARRECSPRDFRRISRWLERSHEIASSQRKRPARINGPFSRLTNMCGEICWSSARD